MANSHRIDLVTESYHLLRQAFNIYKKEVKAKDRDPIVMNDYKTALQSLDDLLDLLRIDIEDIQRKAEEKAERELEGIRKEIEEAKKEKAVKEERIRRIASDLGIDYVPPIEGV